jgi:hypothetical protein
MANSYNWVLKYEPKTCERCNNSHVCTGSSNCDCFDVDISAEMLDDLAVKYDDCLCKKCLEALKNP